MNSDANGPQTDTVSIGVIGQSVSSACAILSGGLLYLVAADSESFDRHGIKKNMYAAWAVVLSLSAAIGFRTGNLDHIHICAWIIGSAALLHGFAGLMYPRWFHKFYEDPRNPCERPNSSSPFRRHPFPTHLLNARTTYPQHARTRSGTFSCGATTPRTSPSEASPSPVFLEHPRRKLSASPAVCAHFRQRPHSVT
jgi:hypothetical protein